MKTAGQARIIVLGGGFGGLETAFFLHRRLRDRARVTLVSDQDYFLFKPNTIYIPFGLDPNKLMISLDRPTRRQQIGFIMARVHDIDPIAKTIRTNGQKIAYDFLVVATGAGMRPQEVPGLDRYAETIWTPMAMLRLRRAFRQLSADARQGRPRRVLFLVPPNNKWASPLYEMALMLDTWLRHQGARPAVDITWTTYEDSYIQVFGPRLHEVVTQEFERRGITGYNRHVVERVEKGGVIYRDGRSLPFNLLVSSPPYVASTPFPGLPMDTRGFLATDSATRQVVGHPEIYAVGDAGDFPVKQAFLASLQADAAADHLASQILQTQPARSFEPTSLCVMEQFDKATFAQVPLRLTGVPTKPVEVRPDAAGLYKVGSSPMWRLGKRLLGVYLPWQFETGNPLYTGLTGKGMELGVKVMSSLLAR